MQTSLWKPPSKTQPDNQGMKNLTELFCPKASVYQLCHRPQAAKPLAFAKGEPLPMLAGLDHKTDAYGGHLGL